MYASGNKQCYGTLMHHTTPSRSPHNALHSPSSQILQQFCCLQEHVYSEHHRKTRKTGYCAHDNERERALSAAESAEQRQERLTKQRQIGLGALPRLLMHKFVQTSYCALCIYTLQTCSIYVLPCMLLSHTRPTMHHICLVIGASMSESPSSDANGTFLCIIYYIYICICHTLCHIC